MKELTTDEMNHVDGGLLPVLVTIVIATIGAGAYLGEKMAERDNRASS